MADDLTPDIVRAQRFDAVRKGYDRAQVEAFVADVAERLDELEAVVAASRANDIAIGIDESEALARELHTIGDGVAEILEAARSAAEGMRTRAATDAARWTSEAEEKRAATLRAATEDSQSLRASAWNEGSSMLASAVAEAQSIIATAKEETLYLRAEAEREALRLTSDARRDSEEASRAARLEAEQVIDAARTESESVLAAANQQAELAQERARALEERRTELLHELEAARSSITVLESEIESKRQELEDPVIDEPESDDGTHHSEDGGSVRIVSPSSVVSLAPVDPDEFVAEVVALRAEVAATPPSVPEPSVVVGDSSDEAPDAAAAHVSDEAPSAPVHESPSHVVSPSDGDASEEAEDRSGSLARDDDDQELTDAGIADAGPSAGESGSEVSPLEPNDSHGVGGAAPEPTPPDGDDADRSEPHISTNVPSEVEGDAIGSLFAQLRDGAEDVDAAADATDTPATPTDTGSQPYASRAEADGPDVEHGDGDSPVDRAVEPDSSVPDAATAIPLLNDALRSIKRILVELQNETLEHLRTDGTWIPDEAFVDRFTPAFTELSDATGTGIDSGLGSVFAADLYDAVTSAIERIRSAGGGEREVAAAASKVFRMWRSDEAERRVFDATSTVLQA